MSITGPHYAKLENALGARYADNTRRTFLGQAERFMRLVGPKPIYGRADVVIYLDELVQTGYKEQSIHTILAGVRALFAANGWPWPLTRRDMHLGLPQEDSGGPIMSTPDIAILVAAGRRLVAPECPAICLSTIYGLRAAEIAAVLSAGISGSQIAVQTAKTGRKREHQIPEGLERYLYCPARPITTDGMHKMFDRIMERFVRPSYKREGWHAIRRALITELLDANLPGHKLHKWFGWRVPPSELSKIAFRYFRPGDLDTEVYAIHPFLGYWR